ncbi:MAG TPA: hypothetical protein VK753_04225 [Xanthomonadaceae bacterium]|jgi:UDP-3-O-[3-hydroxymyristoyl] glucosamine N-acyltransferase|nr:hypothetical protein [Xanthomonadaceae bacterium]
MEYFPARRPCPLNSLPTLASIPQAADAVFHGVTLIDNPRAGCLTFCEKPPAGDAIDLAVDSTILVAHELAVPIARSYPRSTLLPVDDPRATFIDTLEYLQRSGLLGATSLLPENPSIASDARIGERAVVETGVQVDPGVSIGSGAIVRSGTWLRRGVTVGENCVIGTSGINAYVGRDGRRRGFPHLAGVMVGEGASVGAACVVVRGILSSTRIGTGSIVGNLCNIGHGVEIEENVWISVGTMVGGHTRIGAKATIGLSCAIRDNVRIGAAANVGMGSVVTKHVRAGASVFGNPARTYDSLQAGPAR